MLYFPLTPAPMLEDHPYLIWHFVAHEIDFIPELSLHFFTLNKTQSSCHRLRNEWRGKKIWRYLLKLFPSSPTFVGYKVYQLSSEVFPFLFSFALDLQLGREKTHTTGYRFILEHKKKKTEKHCSFRTSSSFQMRMDGFEITTVIFLFLQLDPDQIRFYTLLCSFRPFIRPTLRFGHKTLIVVAIKP